jgi:hypothetical protein
MNLVYYLKVKLGRDSGRIQKTFYSNFTIILNALLNKFNLKRPFQ